MLALLSVFCSIAKYGGPKMYGNARSHAITDTAYRKPRIWNLSRRMLLVFKHPKSTQFYTRVKERRDRYFQMKLTVHI